jgi:hypothetical protein
LTYSDGRLLRGVLIDLFGQRGPAFQIDRRCFSPEPLWIQVAGNELVPFFSEGDLIRAALSEEEPDGAHLGRLCILSLKEKGYVFGVPSASSLEGRYNVRSLVGPDIPDVEIELFLPVLATFYRSAFTGKLLSPENITVDTAMSG